MAAGWYLAVGEDDDQVVVQAKGSDRWHGWRLLAGLIFKRVWKLTGREDAPEPTDGRRGWGEILLAATLQGAILGLVKAAVDRGAVKGARRLTGIWPGDEGKPNES